MVFRHKRTGRTLLTGGKQMNAGTVACAPSGLRWQTIKWVKLRRQVRKLQARIVKATQDGKYGKVKALQWLLTHSFSGKALAVKRVTENDGKKTPGVDRIIWNTSTAKTKAIVSLQKRGYKPLPLLRVLIPKKKDKTRPIGILAMKDRGMQALYLLALEPVAETTADRNSYGFRPERSTADAGAKCFMCLAGKNRAEWVLEADITGCFDNISHDWMTANIPTDKTVLQKWLKAGFVYQHKLFPTEAGTPQGGVISPALANMTLDGLEKALAEAFPRAAQQGLKMNMVRYADDCAPRRRTGGRKSSVQPSCTRDEGGPFGVAVQAETSNHLLLLHLRDVVVSESGKGRARPCQIRTVESNANEPLMTCRKRRNDVKTGRESLTRDKSGSNLLTGQTASGIKAARTRLRLLCGTWEPVTPMLREKHKERSSKCQSTDAGYRGGVTCSSDEGSVMELERRGYPIRSETREQPVMGGFA